MPTRIGLVTLLFAWLALAGHGHAAADREKLLNDPGVYGTFVVFKVDEAWWKLDQAARVAAAAEAKAVFQKHGERASIRSSRRPSSSHAYSGEARAEAHSGKRKSRLSRCASRRSDSQRWISSSIS